MQPVIAILDIGKTNKKLFLIDEHYRIVWEKNGPLPEISDEDGDPCEDVQALTRWVQEGLREVLGMETYLVKAVNCSAYGASFVLTDKNGQVAAPLYNYLKPYPAALQQRFFDLYNTAGDLPGITASPVLGSLNSGLQLYRLKHLQPALFGSIRYALHLPQYISFLVTGHACTDITSIGCHTMLWNFREQQYHEWVRREGILDKLPPLHPSDAVVPAQLEGHSLVAGGGLHDSSAALIPYLAGFTEPFALISTGTWCITLNPFNHHPLTAAELEQDCLCYLEYKGRPVKAARLFAGHEHEQQVQRLAAHFGVAPDHYRQVEYDPALIHTLGRPQQPALNRFAGRPLTDFPSYEAAYHQLMTDLVAAQQHSTQLVLDNTDVKRIFVDGGFSRNPLYMHLLAAAFPHLEVYAASVAQATAIGAALAIHRHWNSRTLPGDLVELRLYKAEGVKQKARS
ncbi:FGGY-family carbohydrate kinase [Chitinophaga japonensis]|uniref:Sugar (Pentulose or hexulose) kinase n=1 Tax=Chitinophaga japonensis TaxID=104662 RepID=A0A562T092_CHIJA|nr:FGGY family carbohydrate kinase [Chitinophaga japonensis]TWI86947.1 sugar (pentulose or hexulose) kinase [Chitinophaga japonensis]